MAQQQFNVDPRLPTTTLPESDPAHPRNIVKNSKILMNQAVADTRYDAAPPARIESFTNTVQSLCYYPLVQSSCYYPLFLTLLIAIGFYLLLIPRPMYQRVVLAVSVVYGLHLLTSHYIHKKCTLNN